MINYETLQDKIGFKPMAWAYLAVPATSTPSECTFSSRGGVTTATMHPSFKNPGGACV